MSETIIVTGNAGQGKTTIAANIATVLARFGMPTFLANADERTPKLHYHFGIQIPNGTEYSHSSGLSVRFKPKPELPKGKIRVVDAPTYDNTWYNTEYPAVIVTKPDYPSIIEALKLKKHIKNVKGVIINKAEHDGYELSPGNINHFLDLPVIGVVPYDKSMREALKKGHPLTELKPNEQTATILRRIAANLINQEYKTGK